jgi:NADH-quinone oxidoreductase subunit M
MGFVTLNFTATTQGVEGGIFQMISHGNYFAALLCVGVVYDRLHTRNVTIWWFAKHAQHATIFTLMLGSVDLPVPGFVGEFCR